MAGEKIFDFFKKKKTPAQGREPGAGDEQKIGEIFFKLEKNPAQKESPPEKLPQSPATGPRKIDRTQELLERISGKKIAQEPSEIKAQEKQVTKPASPSPPELPVAPPVVPLAQAQKKIVAPKEPEKQPVNLLPKQPEKKMKKPEPDWEEAVDTDTGDGNEEDEFKELDFPKTQTKKSEGIEFESRVFEKNGEEEPSTAPISSAKAEAESKEAKQKEDKKKAMDFSKSAPGVLGSEVSRNSLFAEEDEIAKFMGKKESASVIASDILDSRKKDENPLRAEESNTLNLVVAILVVLGFVALAIVVFYFFGG
ncbi:MAG: hypothetical protein NUV67_01905 [archaeon]|nr:hypothetical protein [archaeon]